MGSLQKAYQSIYYNEQELREEVADFCNEFFFDTEEETEYFVEELFKDEDIVLEFFDDVLEFSSESQLNEDTYITEIRSALIKYGLKAAKGLLKKATPAVRGMSAKTLTKQGIQAGGLTKKGTSLAKNKQAFATQTRAIQTARATRQAGIPKPQEPNKYLKMLQQKRASRGLPPAGGTSAQSLKAITQRGITRHNQAIDQLNIVAKSFMKMAKQSAASSKLATAAKGTKTFGPAMALKGAKPGGPLATTGRGGPLATTGKAAGLGPVSKVELVTVKDLGGRMSAGKNKAATAAAGSKGSGTTYQGTRSGGQLPGKDVKGLPGVGQANNRRNLAQKKLDDAAKGSTASSINYTSKGVRQLGPEKLSSKVKRTMDGLKKLPTGAKLAGGATLLGLTAAGLGVKDPLAKKTGEINLPDKDTAPTTPPGGVVADKGKKDDTKGPGGYKIPDTAKPKTGGYTVPDVAKPKTVEVTADSDKKSKTPTKLSKMERNARELKIMRARSLDRQGRSSDAEKLRAEIKKKYG